MNDGYPVRFSVDYPDRQLDRLAAPSVFHGDTDRSCPRDRVALMEDRYPSTDDQQYVHLDFPYPDARDGLNRWLPLVKWFLAIPDYVFLYIGLVLMTVVAWFAILFTGRYPRGIFDYVEGVIGWHNRVVGYAFVLVTDQYPPFELRPSAVDETERARLIGSTTCRRGDWPPLTYVTPAGATISAACP